MSGSPTVTKMSWGKTELSSGQSFKDAKLYPSGARAWDWRETGTQHEPGIQPADVTELLDKGARIIVLSRGMQGCLHVTKATEELLKSRGVDYHMENTMAAVELYNRLANEGKPVGALFHSTC